MRFLSRWIRKGPKENVHVAKPPWLGGEATQDELILKERKQLRLMSVYGIGGCSMVNLTDGEMDTWFDFAMGDRKDTVGIRSLLARAIPKAYDAVITRRIDCREYFLGEHNARVRATKTAESRIRLCLAREGEIKEVMGRALAKPLLMTNTIFLKSRTGKRLCKVGLITTEYGEEHAFLDFVPSASIGDAVIIHRNVACEVFRDDGAPLF